MLFAETILTEKTGQFIFVMHLSRQTNLLYTESLYDWWRSFLNRNSLSKMDLHELRHTNFTFIGRHASLFDLKHFAGWSILEPAKRYVHNNQDMLRKAIDDAGL